MSTDNFPSIALGTWSWGHGSNGGDKVFGHHLGEKELKPVVTKAMENGLNLWDTATVYGEGTSETILGNLLKPYDRNQYFLSTKFTPAMSNGLNLASDENAMIKMLEGSLDRLHTDYVDIYWIHNPTDVKKWTPQLIPLLKSGNVKYVGVSNHNLDQIKEAQQILTKEGFHISAVQNHYSLLHRFSEKTGILNYCRKNNMKFFSYMTLEQGALTGKYNVKHPFPEGNNRAKNFNPILSKLNSLLKTIKEISQKHDASVAEISTAWAINKGALPIIGVTKPEYIKSELKASSIQLSGEEITRLEESAKQTGIDTNGFQKAMS